MNGGKVCYKFLFRFWSRVGLVVGTAGYIKSQKDILERFREENANKFRENMELRQENYKLRTTVDKPKVVCSSEEMNEKFEEMQFELAREEKDKKFFQDKLYNVISKSEKNQFVLDNIQNILVKSHSKRPEELLKDIKSCFDEETIERKRNIKIANDMFDGI